MLAVRPTLDRRRMVRGCRAQALLDLLLSPRCLSAAQGGAKVAHLDLAFNSVTVQWHKDQ